MQFEFPVKFFFSIESCAEFYLVSHDKEVLLIGKVQHLLYALLTLHLT